MEVPPEALPAVAPHDLVRAWHAATVGAELSAELLPHGDGARPGRVIGALFRRPDGNDFRMLFSDSDAQCWADALDRTFGLDSLHGTAVCFRLLGLISLMASAPWMRDHFEVGGGDGPHIRPAVMRVAATLPLTAEARFDAAAFRAALEPLIGPRRLGRS